MLLMGRKLGMEFQLGMRWRSRERQRGREGEIGHGVWGIKRSICITWSIDWRELEVGVWILVRILLLAQYS